MLGAGEKEPLYLLNEAKTNNQTSNSINQYSVLVTTKIFFFTTVIVLLMSNLLFGQVVDIERQRIDSENNGLSGSLNLSGSYLDNDQVIYSFNVLSNLQYRKDEHLFLLIGDYKISRSLNTDFQDAAFLHLRYNRPVRKGVTLEAFTQIQDDKISLLKYRFLSGVGARLQLINDQSLLVNFGVIPMYEFEELLDDASTIHRDLRISQYLNIVLNISETADFYTTTYYQPIYNLWEDYRLHNESRLVVLLSEKMNLNITNTYSWDANPPVGAPKKRINLKVGLGLDF